MRIILLGLLLILPTIGLADVRSCQTLYSNGPQTLGGYRLTNGLNLEAKHRGHGFMFRYQRSKRDIVSVVFYDNGKKRISQDDALQELFGVATMLTSYLNNGGNIAATYLDKSRAPSEPLEIYELSDFQTMRAKAVLSSPKSAGNNLIAIGTVNNCLVKLRYTTGGSAKQADSKFQRLLRDLDNYLLQQQGL